MFVTGTEEIHSAAAVTNWLSTGLQSVLPENVQADLHKLALSGHSRGGKAAFALALGHAQTSLKFYVCLSGISSMALAWKITALKIGYDSRENSAISIHTTSLNDNKNPLISHEHIDYHTLLNDWA